MKIVLTFDTGYAPHAATVMESIIQNCPEKLDFAIIYYDLNQETQDILSKHFFPKVKSLELYKVEKAFLQEKFNHVKTLPYITNCFSSMLRLLIADLLPITDEHVVYLDCDTIVCDNILNIVSGGGKMDLSKPICAVVEYDPTYKWRDLGKLNMIEIPSTNSLIYEAYYYRAYCNLGMNPHAAYFNSGVLIINLKYWRENQISLKTIQFIAENPNAIFAADQDALNAVINGNFSYISPKWNNFLYINGVMTNYPVTQLQEAKKYPSIIHVAGPIKPWHYLCEKKNQDIYWKYRQNTPWAKTVYVDKTFKKIIVKQVFRPIKKSIRFLIGQKTINYLKGFFPKEEMFWSKARLKK